MPARHARRHFAYKSARVAIVIPTYAPDEVMRRLVHDCLRFNPNTVLYIVDDSTPSTRESTALFQELSRVSQRLTLLRTTCNRLKAGALNFALQHIYQSGESAPDVIIIIDDDVVIGPSTVRNLVVELMSHRALGAVCSQCRVHNKNKNLLTRLQGLEYVGFNAIRLADEGFLRGPLVMHGMLTAFRAQALREVGGFAEGHLIEDYEVTTRLKAHGWSVKSAANAPAWTVVPESLAQFWRQRTRWSYGGMTVVANSRRHLSAVFQDIVGHAVFLSTLFLIFVLLFSKGAVSVPQQISQWIIALSLIQLGAWYAFQLWLMRSYEERDWQDWVLRASLVPEFIYGYAMTFALVGSYFFLAFNMLARALPAGRQGTGARASRTAAFGRKIFLTLGYTEKRWGTRALPAMPTH